MVDKNEGNSSDPEMDLEVWENRWVSDEGDFESDLMELDPEELADQAQRDGRDYLMDAASLLDSLMLASGADDVTEQMDDYTDDPDVIEDFAERQSFTAAPEQLYTDLMEHTALSPELSAGDLDARWQDADQSGEEAVGGTVMTPDQDVVDELGEAVGVEYDDDEPLHTYDKLAARDQHRWELDPASANENEEVSKGSPLGEEQRAGRSGTRRRKHK